MNPLSIRPLSETFAAELRGVDLRLPIDQQRLDALYDAFLRHGVVVLPGQALSIDQQLAFARLFGPLHSLPVKSLDGRRIKTAEIDDVSNLNSEGGLAGIDSEKVMFTMGNQLWHSDLSFCENPAHASMLHALEIAQDGGETEFCDLAAAYAALPQSMKSRLEGLVAEHSLAHSRILGGYDTARIDAILKLRPPSLQPLVRTHPETGETILFVGAHVSRIIGLAQDESKALIAELVAHATQPRFVFQHRWAVHDLVIWDNRRTLHRGRPYDAGATRRVMHRATVDGDGPTVIDGVIVQPEVRRRNLTALQQPAI